MTQEQIDSIRWRARRRAARKYGVAFNEAPPDEKCKQLQLADKFQKEAEDEFRRNAKKAN